MKKSALFLAALGSATLLLGSCNQEPAADTTAAATTAAPPAAAHDMAGMDHSAPAAAAGERTAPLVVSMNEMMRQMHAVTPKGNADYDFARHMLEHHRGAVVMADLELRDGQDATMRQLATQIKADQSREIAALEAAAARLAAAPATYQPTDPTDPFTQKMKASMDEMMEGMPATTADPDVDFNQIMTVHHQSAVAMAQAELAHGKDPKLKEMARQMVSAQQKEIQQFRDWLSQTAGKN